METSYGHDEPYSRLLSRLRTDFDLPPACEEDYILNQTATLFTGDSDDNASLESQLAAIDADGARRDPDNPESDADEDSTVLSNADYASVNLQQSIRTSEKEARRETLLAEGKKRVDFDNVTVREYKRVIGDNPAVSSGVPIGLGWEYSTYLDLDVDIYESSVRKPGPRTRRHYWLTPQNRFSILRDV